MIRNAILSVSAVLLAAAPGNSPLDQCASTAVAICGEGNVCCLCVVGEPPSCSFGCRDAEGHCQPCPACGPQEWVAHEFTTELVVPGVHLVVGRAEAWLVLGFGDVGAVRVK